MISHRVIARRPDLGQRATVRLFLVVGVVLALFVGMGTRASQAFAAKKESANSHTDARELQAREAFASSRYREALDLYAKLYAEKLHPTYLRNIGRCHQNMGEAEEAIISFRDYLRKAPDLTSGEREEVDGFIKEMETLRDKQRQQQNDKQAAAVQTVPAPAGQSPIGQYAPPAGAPAGAAATVPAGADLSRTPAPEASPPVYKRTWFWVAVGTVVAAGVVGALWAGGAFSSSNNCPDGYVCPKN